MCATARESFFRSGLGAPKMCAGALELPFTQQGQHLSRSRTWSSSAVPRSFFSCAAERRMEGQKVHGPSRTFRSRERAAAHQVSGRERTFFRKRTGRRAPGFQAAAHILPTLFFSETKVFPVVMAQRSAAPNPHQKPLLKNITQRRLATSYLPIAES